MLGTLPQIINAWRAARVLEQERLGRELEEAIGARLSARLVVAQSASAR
jgi:hypothetical protein